MGTIARQILESLGKLEGEVPNGHYYTILLESMFKLKFITIRDVHNRSTCVASMTSKSIWESVSKCVRNLSKLLMEIHLLANGMVPLNWMSTSQVHRPKGKRSQNLCARVKKHKRVSIIYNSHYKISSSLVS